MIFEDLFVNWVWELETSENWIYEGDDLLKSKPEFCVGKQLQNIWIGALDLEPKSVGGDARPPIQGAAIFCHFLIWIKRPTSYPPLYNGDVGRGWLPLFWVFQREEEGERGGGGGTVIGQCGEGLGLSNSPVSGKSYIEGRYNPRNLACDKELKHRTDRRLYLGIWTESFSA